MTKSPQWNSAPYDPALTSNTNQFLSWLQQSVVALQAATTGVDAPTLAVNAVGSSNSIRLQWSSVPGAVKYYVYETVISGVSGDPVAIVAANASGGQNVFVRSRPGFGFFFYAVQGVDVNGQTGTMSEFKAGQGLPENIEAFGQPPPILFNYNMSTNIVIPSPFVALDKQAITFVFGQQPPGGFTVTWPSNVTSAHGTIATGSGQVSIQNFVYWAGDGVSNGPHGTLYPTSAMIIT